MRLIPVIDLQHGQVVSAVGGDRELYQPLRTPLSASTTFKSVADGLLHYCPSPNLYIADLDAIECAGNHRREIAAYLKAKPDLNVWLDSGLHDLSASVLTGLPDNLHVVVGSENFPKTADLQSVLPLFGEKILLSLDFRGADFLGPAHLLEQHELWPQRVIVMTLNAVGKAKGPDFQRVAEIIAQAGSRDVYAAGGVRSLADLKQLSEIGAAGALVSTALHTGQIKTGDLDQIAGF